MALDAFDQSDESRLRENSYATGITVFDNEILQGIPAGSMVAILGDSRGMGELFNYHLVHTDRPTHYISTGRPARHIEQDLAKMGELPSDLNITDVFATSDSAKEILLTYSARLKEGHNLILDTASGYEMEADNEGEFLQTLRNVYSNVEDKDAIAYLYFSTNDLSELSRAEREALHMCDGIFNIRIQNNGDSIDTVLEVTKMRGRDFTDELVKLNVGKMMTIDTTRDIA